jgi:hypothetical protein
MTEQNAPLIVSSYVLPLDMIIIPCMLQSLLRHSGRQQLKKIYKTLVSIVMNNIPTDDAYRCTTHLLYLSPTWQWPNKICWNMHNNNNM